MSKWDLQSSQIRPVDAWQCLTSGQHSPKCPFQRSSLTCWMMGTQSQLLPSIHHIFWVVHILTQKTYSCISLSSPCSFPKHKYLLWNHAKQVLCVTSWGHPSQHNTATLLSPFVVLVVYLPLCNCGMKPAARVMSRKPEIMALKPFQLGLWFMPLSFFLPTYVYLSLFS